MRGWLIAVVVLVAMSSVWATPYPSEVATILVFNESLGAVATVEDEVNMDAYTVIGGARIADVGPAIDANLDQSLMFPNTSNDARVDLYRYYDSASTTSFNSTVEFWWMPRSGVDLTGTANIKTFFSQRHSQIDNTGMIIYYRTDTNTLSCYWEVSSGVIYQVKYSLPYDWSVSPYGNDTWTHTACVFNQEYIMMAVNGTNVSSLSFNTSQPSTAYEPYPSTRVADIANYSGAGANYNDYYLAHYRLWNTSRSADNISSHMTDSFFETTASSQGGYLYPYNASLHKRRFDTNTSWGQFHPSGNMLHTINNVGSGSVTDRDQRGGCFGLYYGEGSAPFGSTNACETKGGGTSHDNWAVNNQTWFPHKIVMIGNRTSNPIYQGEAYNFTASGDEDVIAFQWELYSGRNTSNYSHPFTIEFQTGTLTEVTDVGPSEWMGFNLTFTPNGGDGVQSGDVSYLILFSKNSSNISAADRTIQFDMNWSGNESQFGNHDFLTMVFVEANATFGNNETLVDAWLRNFTNRTLYMRDLYNLYAGGFKYPTNISSSNESVDRYYQAIWEYWALQFKVPWNQRDMQHYVNPDNSSNYSLMFMVPYPRTYFGQWIWDTASADFGVLAAINQSDPKNQYALRYVEDHMTIMANQNDTARDGSGTFEWYRYIYPGGVFNTGTQPLGMFEVTNWYLNQVVRNNTNQLCSFYPVLKAQFNYFNSTKTSATTNLCIFDQAADGGRDGTVYTDADYMVDCTGWLQNSAYYLNKTATICNDTSTDFNEDFQARRRNISAYMWKDDLRLDSSATRYSGYANLDSSFNLLTNTNASGSVGTVLTGNMGLLLWNPTTPESNVSALWTTLSGALFTHPTTAYYPTSLTTNNTEYSPSYQWNGPIWHFDLLHNSMGFLNYGYDEGFLGLQAQIDAARSHNLLNSESYDAASLYPNSSWNKEPNAPGVGMVLYSYSATNILSDTANLSDYTPPAGPPSISNWTNITTNNSVWVRWDHSVPVNVTVEWGTDLSSLSNFTNWSIQDNVTWNYTYNNLSENTAYYANITVCQNGTGCTMRTFTYTTSATTLEYPAYSALSHPRLFGGDWNYVVTLSSWINATQTSANQYWHDYAYLRDTVARSVAQGNTSCHARTSANPAGRAAQLWATALVGALENDAGRMRIAQECMDWWFVNASPTVYNNLDAHTRGRVYYDLALSLDVVWENLTEADQNRYMDGLTKNLTSVQGILNDTDDVNFANHTQLDRENGRFIRSGLVTLCWVSLGHGNASVEKLCGDESKNWTANTNYSVKSLRNAQMFLAPDGHLDYYVYGMKTAWGSWILHDRMADQGFNFTKYNVSYPKSFAGMVNSLYYPIIDAKYDANETYNFPLAGRLRSIVLGDTNMYSGLHPDMVMTSNALSWSMGYQQALSWWLFNESSQNSTEYMYNVTSFANNFENRYLEQFWLYNPNQVNSTPPWEGGHINTTMYALEGAAIYKGTTMDSPYNPAHLYFAHFVMDQSGGHPQANANDIVVSYNGEVGLMQAGGENPNDGQRSEGWMNSLLINETYSREKGRFLDEGEEEPHNGYQRHGLGTNWSANWQYPGYSGGYSWAFTNYSQVVMSHAGAANRTTDADWPNVSWANNSQRGLPEAYHGSAYGEAMTLTGRANYYTLRGPGNSPSWHRTSVVFEGDVVVLGEHIWNTLTTTTAFQFVYHTPGIWTVTDGFDTGQVSAYSQVNQTRFLMEWGGFDGANMSLQAWPRNETVFYNRAAAEDDVSSLNMSVLWALANNGTVANNWTHLSVILPYNSSRDPRPNTTFVNTSTQKSALVNHSNGPILVSTPVNRGEALSNTLNVSYGPIGSLSATAYALVMRFNTSQPTSLYVVNTTSVTYNSTTLAKTGADQKYTLYLNLSNESSMKGSVRAYNNGLRLNLSYAHYGSEAIVNRVLVDGATASSVLNSTSDQTISFLLTPDDDHSLYVEANQSMDGVAAPTGSSTSELTVCSSLGSFLVNTSTGFAGIMGVIAVLFGTIIVLVMIRWGGLAIPYPLMLGILAFVLVVFFVVAIAATVLQSAFC